MNLLGDLIKDTPLFEGKWDKKKKKTDQDSNPQLLNQGAYPPLLCYNRCPTQAITITRPITFT